MKVGGKLNPMVEKENTGKTLIPMVAPVTGPAANLLESMIYTAKLRTVEQQR